MEIRGRVHNGVVVLEGGPVLPKGLAVNVSYDLPPISAEQGTRIRVEFPLVRSKCSGSFPRIAERIAEVLEEEDVSP